MAKNTDAIILALLEKDWNVTSNPGIGQGIELTVSVPRPDARITMTHILASVINHNTGLVTSTVVVRDASETGTILWQHNFAVLNTTQQQLAADVYVSAFKGSNMFIGMLTAQASVSASISAQGFIDDMR
jgi:hypothetical protein